MTRAIFLTVLLLAASVNASKHRLCACISDQGAVGVQIDDKATKEVVMGSDGRFVYNDGIWFNDELHDAPYGGAYWHAIDGTINGATDDGWVGGDEANGLCKEKKTDSACFSPGDSFDWQRCSPNDKCFTSKAAKTDGFGNPA